MSRARVAAVQGGAGGVPLTPARAADRHRTPGSPPQRTAGPVRARKALVGPLKLCGDPSKARGTAGSLIRVFLEDRRAAGRTRRGAVRRATRGARLRVGAGSPPSRVLSRIWRRRASRSRCCSPAGSAGAGR